MLKDSNIKIYMRITIRLLIAKREIKQRTNQAVLAMANALACLAIAISRTMQFNERCP